VGVPVGDPVARCLDQDQVAGTPVRSGHTHVVLALLGSHTRDGHDHRLARLEALEHGGVQQFRGPFLDLLVGDPAGQQPAHLVEGQHGRAVLDHAARKVIALLWGTGHDEHQAPW